MNTNRILDNGPEANHAVNPASGARCVNGHLARPDGGCDVCAYQRPSGRAESVVTMVEARPPEAPQFPRTDAGNAELFCHLLGDQLRFDHRRKRWLRWGGHWWIADPDSQVIRLAKEAVRRRYRDAAAIDDLREREAEARWAIQSESKVRLDAMLALARAEKPIADAGDGWDVDPWLLGVGNGVIDLRTGMLRDGKQADRLTMRTPVDYDPDAECPRWEEFVTEVFAGDEELIDYIRRAVGYSLTGETIEQCHFICWGGGWNGKTTFQRVQREVMGDYGANTPFSTLEMSARSSISNDLAALNGRRLVIASELNEAVRLNEARLKMLAGEDPVTARFLYGELFTFIPVAKFWLSVNHKPIVNDDSTGFWRKVHLIPFPTPSENRIEGDVNCDGSVNGADSEFLLQFAAHLIDGTTPGTCPDVGVHESITGYEWGDVNCDGSVNALDALYVLVFTVQLHTLPSPLHSCIPIGSVIT